MNVIGYFPEILVVGEVLICLLVDMVFDKCLDKGIEKLLLSETSFRLDPEVEEENWWHFWFINDMLYVVFFIYTKDMMEMSFSLSN